MKKFLSVALLAITVFSNTKAQQRTPAQQLILTNEDSLHAGKSQNNRTVISGYGSASYQRNFNAGFSQMNLDRAVLFVGHRFNEKIAFFSELEVEDAKVDGSGGEAAMEQAFLKFNLNDRQYLVAGLFIPRIGILNENHLPVNFNGVERPIVEQLIIPATWRELGVGLYGSFKNAPVNYTLGILNGLNSAGFDHGSGIRDGRAEGRDGTANNLALTGSVQYKPGDFLFQVSGYAGGTVGLNRRAADSLNLNSGGFGTPVYLGEGDIQYNHKGFSAKALFAYISYPDANKINLAYAKNLATGMYGTYAEAAYDWLYKKKNKGELISFVRYEMLDLNSSLASNSIYDGTEKQSHIIVGLGYLPIPNVVIKADVRLMHTGPQNSALVINPPPNALPYQQNNQFLNLGIGYSF
ncbi:hypothetical protein [Ferruginibacter albus]|uniref:hypothetical protein n=1 Tax=Ferruginibacter albus TaxID=2875540 RepID=UPI001CC51D7C|nr:hypothetical protein [Ferruginibacter albus]UAY51554.1 hypothetical protein K9M53_13275 [Ferruginibacter albus]